MKRVIFTLILAGCAIALSQRADAHVRMIYPMGGESFFRGDVFTIEWVRDQQHNQMNWDLYLSTDGGATWGILAVDIPEGMFSYQWTIQKLIPITTRARIKVVQDNVGYDYEAESLDFTISAVATAIEDETVAPDSPMLLSGYPNPFSTSATLDITLSRTGPVSLEIYDTLGRKVSVLVKRVLASGTYRFTWQAADRPSGIYLSVLKSGDRIQSRALIHVR